MGQVTDLAVSAILLAGLYATMAYGLGLIYGVLRIVNLNHGGMIMAGADARRGLHPPVGVDPHPSLLPPSPPALVLRVVDYPLPLPRPPPGPARGRHYLL